MRMSIVIIVSIILFLIVTVTVASGNKTLLDASYEGDEITVKKLISVPGVNLNIKEKEGDRRGYTALMIACKEVHIRIVRKLVAAGADLNVKAEAGGPKGATALMIAWNKG